MARLSWLQRLYWRYLSKPVEHRALFLHVIEHPVGSILEIGIGTGERIKQVIELNTLPEGVAQLRYAGVDPFESVGPSVPHMTLKNAHRALSELGVKAHLIPGEPSNGLPRVAHSVMPSDLIIIDGDWETGTPNSNAIAQWLPRLCHATSTIFAASKTGGPLVSVPLPNTVADVSAYRKAA